MFNSETEAVRLPFPVVLCLRTASIFTSLFNNFAAFGQVFIPSGGRVGAARLNRLMSLIRG